ncbi:MAG TPA: MarR family transcriptional regulator [Polyangia bacterium]|nr:MarR family transcriptional regulator [Polyangia bacterium]
MSGAQLFVLQKLDPAHPLSLKELAARTLTHQSSVSVVVSKLVERGLVQRRPAESDARRLAILPTKEGMRLRGRAPAPAAQDRLLTALSALPAVEQRRLADALEQLVRALGLDEREALMLFTEEPSSRSSSSRAPRRSASRRKKRANKRA